MDFYVALLAMNESLLNVVQSINVLEEVKEEKPAPYIRLKESCVISENSLRVAQVVTAHDLNQYKCRFYKVALKEESSTWLDTLLAIDKEEVNAT